MNVIRWDRLETPESKELIASLCKNREGTALTIGGFDGPHMGHETLFTAVLENARKKNLSPGIVTFTRSPRMEKKPCEYPGDVSTLNLRLARFGEKGFEFVLLIDFSGDFIKMAGSVFFDILVRTVCMRYVAVGHDFRCGHRLDTGCADIAALSRKEGFCFDSIQQVEFDGLRISSSAVRNAIQNADFSLAEHLLGHPFLLDFTAPVWKASGRCLEADIGSFTQILPRRGKYDVMLGTAAGKQLSAVMEIADSSVRVLPPGEMLLPESGTILTVQFGLS